MKTLFFRLLLVVSCCACLSGYAQKRTKKQTRSTTTTESSLLRADSNAAGAKPVLPEQPVFAVDTARYDFGRATQGDLVKHVFRFKNAGQKDLVLAAVTPSCGCTTPRFTQDPVKSGASGEIEVTFNTAGKMGVQQKSITVLANTDPPATVLMLVGEVVSPVIPLPSVATEGGR